MFIVSLLFWNLKNVFLFFLILGINVLEIVCIFGIKFYKWFGIVGSYRFSVYLIFINRMDIKCGVCDDKEICNFYFLN